MSRGALTELERKRLARYAAGEPTREIAKADGVGVSSVRETIRLAIAKASRGIAPLAPLPSGGEFIESKYGPSRVYFEDGPTLEQARWAQARLDGPAVCKCCGRPL